MIEAVGNFARPAGGRRRFARSVCVSLGALAVACPTAAAQLPELTGPVKLPVDDGAVGDAVPDGPANDVVNDVVNQDLPDPVEQVVQDSPVAPVRDEVRRIVNQSTGGGGGSGGGGNGGGDGATGTGSGSGTGSGTGAGTQNGGGGGDTPGGGSRRSDSPRSSRGGGGDRSSRGSDRAAIRRAARSAAAARGAGRSRNAARTRPRQGGTERTGDGDRGAAARTIETIVHAVPTPIWIALGVLSLLALALGARTVAAGRRARALARDRERLLHDVESLERALLPAVPEQIGGLATSVAYRSSDGPAAGGDFYDAFELPDGRVAVLIGDVSGHGAEALESTNSVRSQLHGLLEAGISPRAAIAMVGERAPVQLAGRFTTVVVAVHDPAAGTLTYAAAGHPPPIIVAPGADELLSTGASPPIGVGLRTGVRETTVAVPAGAVICLYTDGVVEARAGGAMLGRARLETMVGELGPDDAALELLERVVAEADEASDDLTVCLLRSVAGSASAPSPHVEMLEIDSDDLDSGFARRFLAACGVPAGRVVVAIDHARTTVESQGRALLEVTVADGRAAASVAAPEASAPATAV
jgi:serine phosphatase RsbU (regulator of sigma subunit)